MKQLYVILCALLLQSLSIFAQSALQVKQDTVKVRNAELIIENNSRNVQGVLHNAGNGQVTFQRLQLEKIGDTAIAITGHDTLNIRLGAGSTGGSQELHLSVRAIDATQQQLKWWKAPQDLYTAPKVGVIGGSQGKGAYTSTYANSIIGRLEGYLQQVASGAVVTNYCQNGYNTRRLMPDGSNQWVDVTRNITKALSDGNKIIILVTPSNDADPNNPWGGATTLTETMSNIAAIDDACNRAGATLFVFSGFPRHDFAMAARIQQLDLSYLLLEKFGSRCAFVYKLLEDPANPYQINPTLHTGDKAHLNDQGALIAYIPMRDVLVGHFTSNTLISKYVLQRTPSLSTEFTDFQVLATPDVNFYNLSLDNYFYRVRYFHHDGVYSPWSNIVQGIGSVSGQFPVVNAGADQTINLPAPLTLSATASDPVGTITSYQWIKLSGGTATIATPGNAQTAVTNLAPGVYVFRCTVTNNSGLQSSDDVQVTVTGLTIAKTARFNFSLTSKPVSGYNNLYGHPHSAVHTATDATTGIGLNTVATSAWEPNGSSSALDNLNVVNDGGGYIVDQATLANVFFTGSETAVDNLRITGLTAGRLCRILVTGNAVSSPRTTRVMIDSEVKQFNATGNSSKAAIFDYFTVPAGGEINIAIYADETSGSPFGVVSAVVVDEYQDDNSNPDNELPTVNAGSDQSITLPTVPTLTATASDPDGTISSYSWTKISGGSAVITSPNNASTTISDLSAGVYVFRCTVMDNDGGTAYDDVQLTVTAPAVARTGSFNFSLTSNPVTGFVNLYGAPHTTVLSGTSASGIGINTISTSAYAPNGSVSSLDNIAVEDDGGGFIVPQNVLRSIIFTATSIPTDNLQITGLTPGRYCKIMLTANAFSTPRNNRVRVNGVVKQFNATKNSSKGAIFDFVLVPAGGTINIAFYAENTTSFAGLASAVVVEEYAEE
ncbi:PKD domain-containing protein [Chitinophaga cymbidii]